MKIKPDIYPLMPADEYHGHHDSYSKTNLSNFNISGLHMQYHRTHPTENPAFDFGTACHTAILQPELWEKDIVIQPPEIKRRTGKVWAEFKEENQHKTIITQEQSDLVDQCADAIWNNNLSRGLLSQPAGQAEVSCFWEVDIYSHQGELSLSDFSLPGTERFNTLMLKCRPDYLPGENTIVDLKTAADPHPQTFNRMAHNLKYHWSAYLTCWGLSEITGQIYDRYYFVVVSKNPPFDVAIYKVPTILMDLAEKEIQPLLLDLAAADKLQSWRGLPERIIHLNFPKWAFNHDN